MVYATFLFIALFAAFVADAEESAYDSYIETEENGQQNVSHNGSFFMKGKEGYFFYNDPKKEEKKKEEKKKELPPPPPVAKKAPIIPDDIYVRPEFKDIPILPSTPKPLQKFMGDPTVERAKKFLEWQARAIGRARLMGDAIDAATVKYGDSIYPNAAPSSPNTSKIGKMEAAKRAVYGATQLREKGGLIMLFNGDPYKCMECNVMGEIANQLLDKNLVIVSVREEGAVHHPLARYPSIVDVGGKLRKKFGVHGSPPVFVAVFPDLDEFYTVSRNVTSVRTILKRVVQYGVEKKIIEPYRYSPYRERMDSYLASLGGTNNATGADREALILKLVAERERQREEEKDNLIQQFKNKSK